MNKALDCGQPVVPIQPYGRPSVSHPAGRLGGVPAARARFFVVGVGGRGGQQQCSSGAGGRGGQAGSAAATAAGMRAGC